MLNNKILITVVLITVALLFLSGCAVNKEAVVIHPSSDLSGIQSFHVLRHNLDGRRVDRMIAERLKQMGYSATNGLETSPEAEAVVTYKDKWMWDFTMYMVELNIQVRDAESNFPLAIGNSVHTSLTRKTPEEMVEEVLANLFGKASNK